MGAMGVVAVVFAVALPGVASAEGAAVTQLGWWSQRPGASAQPAGGFELALSPSGPISQAAVRIQVDSVQLSSAYLELTESSGVGSEVAGVMACPTTDPWEPANPGSWGVAPEPNCTRSENLSRAGDGLWSADISQLLSVGTISIVLVPSSHADTQGAPIPYQLLFSGARLIASAPGEPAPEPTSAPPPSAPPAAPDTDTTPTQPSDDIPAAPVASATPLPAPTAVAQPTFAPARDEAEPGRAWWRLVILTPLAALVGTGSVFARRFMRERDEAMGA